MTEQKRLYKVIFQNQGQTYIVYAENLYQSDMYGFIEVENYVFSDRTQVIVDPSEEKLKNEFDNVFRSYVPIHAIVRIDEVKIEKERQPKVIENSGENVMPFPVDALPRGGKKPQT